MLTWSNGQDIQLKQLEGTGSIPVGSAAVKRCCICKIDRRKEEDFYWKNKAKGVRSNICKGCQKDLTSGHYQKNRKRYVANAAVRKSADQAKARELIDERRSVPCKDCEETFPVYVMQFDHVIGTKEQNVADTIRLGWSLDRIKREIEKCEVVCANCHAIRTHLRRSV